MSKLKGYDIIIVGLQPWDIEIGSNCKNIALELSKSNRILYVNSPLDRLTSLRKKDDKKTKKRLQIINRMEPAIRKIDDNIWEFYPRIIIESISRLSINFLFDILNKRNNKRFAKELKWAIKELHFSDYIIFNDSDILRSFYLKELLKPKLYVYYTRDNLVAMDYWKLQGARIEPKHMAKADLVVANSTYLARIASQYNPKSYFVGQGCDVTMFNRKMVYEIPQDIVSIKKPIVGYIGALYTMRLDIEILKHIAKNLPEISLVLIGPEDDEFKQSELHEMKNVHFLGSKSPKKLPAYLYTFDVAINPQILNEITIGNYPRKIDEYLAMGKPVVATKTEAMDYFSNYTYLASNKEEYIPLIKKALQEDSCSLQEARSAFAHTHTWKNSVELISEKMDNFLQEKEYQN